MAGRRYLFFVALVFIISICSAVLAEDSNGNINVQITKLDDRFSFVIYVIVGAVVAVALVLSAVLVVRRRSRPAPLVRREQGGGIRLSAVDSRGFRHEGYYDAVFSRPPVQISDEKTRVPVSSDSTAGVERYLKEDERIVLNVLRMKHNQCSQATLRIATDFSKARLSRLLTELESRGIIHKEPQGRKNMVTLKA